MIRRAVAAVRRLFVKRAAERPLLDPRNAPSPTWGPATFPLVYLQHSARPGHLLLSGGSRSGYTTALRNQLCGAIADGHSVVAVGRDSAYADLVMAGDDVTVISLDHTASIRLATVAAEETLNVEEKTYTALQDISGGSWPCRALVVTVPEGANSALLMTLYRGVMLATLAHARATAADRARAGKYLIVSLDPGAVVAHDVYLPDFLRRATVHGLAVWLPVECWDLRLVPRLWEHFPNVAVFSTMSSQQYGDACPRFAAGVGLPYLADLELAYHNDADLAFWRGRLPTNDQVIRWYRNPPGRATSK